MKLPFTTWPPNNTINVGHDNKVLLNDNSVKITFFWRQDDFKQLIIYGKWSYSKSSNI